MSPKRPTGEQLTALRRAFAERRPSSRADFAAAAGLADTTEAQARRAWARGWPPVVAPLEAELGAARDATVATVTAELVAQAMVARAATLGREVEKLAPLVGRFVARLADADVSDTAPVFALAALRSLVSIYAQAGRVASEAVDLERAVAANRENVPLDRYADMTDEEIIAESGLMDELLLRAADRGAIVVGVDGQCQSGRAIA